jgi:hypothetical protein
MLVLHGKNLPCVRFIKATLHKVHRDGMLDLLLTVFEGLSTIFL